MESNVESLGLFLVVSDLTSVLPIGVSQDELSVADSAGNPHFFAGQKFAPAPVSSVDCTLATCKYSGFVSALFTGFVAAKLTRISS